MSSTVKTETNEAPEPVIAGTKSATLYVGDLPETATDEMLFNLFQKSGMVSSVFICRDNSTGRSLGYGYVNFHNANHAEKALKHQNFTRIDGREIRLMWSQPDSSKRRRGEGNVVVKNLDICIDNKTLFDTFSVFGPILSSRVAVDEKGETKCYGFVHYENVVDAKRAIAKVNGRQIAGKAVKVVEFKPRSEREPAPMLFTNVYVKNFTKAHFPNKESFDKFFGSYGEVTSSVLPERDGKLAGYGFVNFKDVEVAKKVVRELNGAEPNKLYVARALSRAQRRRELERATAEWRREIDSRTAGRNVFVKNLPDSVTGEQLTEALSSIGPVEKASVRKDAAGNSRCFGFVLFATKEHAAQAIEHLNNQSWAGKTVYASLWQRKSQRLQEKRLLDAQNPRRAGYGAAGGFAVPQMMAQPYFYPYAQMVPRALGARAAAPREAAAEAKADESLSQQLFERLMQHDPAHAAKITGMFSDMPPLEMARMLENEDLFNLQVNRAYEVLFSSQQQA